MTDTILEYYSFAGGMVAMASCTGGTCSAPTYFLNDHASTSSAQRLSSVIAVLDASGNLLSEQRYLPFGGVRDDVDTIEETDFGYTSQRALDAQGTTYSLGLMDYRARFYSPLLGRFLQPDTLVPGAGNPQAFNRYSYASNNPLNYNDPSGHLASEICMDDGECIENNGKSKPPVCGAQCMVDKIYNAHQYYQSQAASGATTDLEALARLTDFAAMVTDGCLDCFVQGLGATLTGHFQSKAASEELWQRGIAPRLGLQIPNYLHPYYLSIRDSHTELMQTGYSPIFQDPSVEINGTGGNQAHHYWFFVQVGYEDDFLTGVVGSIAHETLLANDPIGRSYQDYALGVEGAKLGAFLRLGIVQPGDVGAYIRNTLSPDSVSSWIWENPPTYMP